MNKQMAGILTAALLLASCTGGDGNANPTASTATTTASATATSTASPSPSTTSAEDQAAQHAEDRAADGPQRHRQHPDP